MIWHHQLMLDRMPQRYLTSPLPSVYTGLSYARMAYILITINLKPSHLEHSVLPFSHFINSIPDYLNSVVGFIKLAQHLSEYVIFMRLCHSLCSVNSETNCGSLIN